MKTLCLVLAASLVVRACSFNTLRLQRLAGRTVLPLARYQTVFSSPNSGDGESQFEEPTAMGLSRPPLDLQANAYQFFDNPVFYYNEWARQGGDAQRKEMFGEKTVEVVLQEITNLSDFMGLTGIRSDYVQAYLDDLPSPELKLHNAGTIALGSATEELERSEKTYTPLESTAALRQKVFEESTVSREQSIYYVLGPSGSGKTFFALNDISTHNVAHDKFATVYCRPGDAQESVKFVDKANGHELLIEWVKTQIQQDEPKVTVLKRLEMHITLILDEAGSSSLRGFFDKKEKVTATYTALKRLATSVRLVVCGTGVSGRELSSTHEAVKFRMVSWAKGDMAEVLKKSYGLGNNECESILSEMLYHPTLNALTSNARSCAFLLGAVYKVFRQFRKLDLALLNNQTPGIVDSVVGEYIKNNGLKDLNNPAERFCVAASVFCAVEDGRNRKEGVDPVDPEFLDLKPTLQYIAKALIESNVEAVDGKSQYISLAENKNIRSAAFVSPAIVFVLCSLLGVEARVLSDWRAQELIIALCEFRRQVVDRYIATSDRDKIKHKDIKLLTLPSPIPATNAKIKFKVPICGPHVVWINGDKAPFADVLGYHTLYQCRHTETDAEYIAMNLSKDLSKCGLLKGQSDVHPGRMTVRGLIAVWNGHLDGGHNVAKPRQMRQLRSLDANLVSHAYPFNQLDHGQVLSLIEYATIEETAADGSVWEMKMKSEEGEKSLPLPDFPAANVNICFVVATNVDEIRLTLDNEVWCQNMSNDDLDELAKKQKLDKTSTAKTITLKAKDGEFVLDALDKETEFLNGVLEGVQIQFLRT